MFCNSFIDTMSLLYTLYNMHFAYNWHHHKSQEWCDVSPSCCTALAVHVFPAAVLFFIVAITVTNTVPMTVIL